MAKQKNPNIGAINCPICQRPSAVRKAVSGKYYFDCPHCGRITPNLDGGQNWVLEHATIWGLQGKPPASVPRWIAEQFPWQEAVRTEGAPRPAPAPPPVRPAASAPVPPPAPVADHLPPPPPEPPKPEPQDEPEQPRGGFSFFE